VSRIFHKLLFCLFSTFLFTAYTLLSRQTVWNMAESIDEVVHKTRGPPYSPPGSRDDSGVDINKKASPSPSPERYRPRNSRDQSRPNTDRRPSTKDYISPGEERSIKSGEASTIIRETQDESSRTTFTDFFSSEIFHLVLRNPTTAHRFLKFCQSRDCGENIEFLQKVCELSLPQNSFLASILV
jgi:hypothetical protein